MADESLLREITLRLSLRAPQEASLRVLARLLDIMPIGMGRSLEEVLTSAKDVEPTVTSFGHAFPSLCFALATGVGKTRLMGAEIAYLHLTGRSKHFLVLAPGTTVYDKLIEDFTPGSAKYVFRGLQHFTAHTPLLVTGDNWDEGRATRGADFFGRGIVVNIFNVGKLDREVGRIRRPNENVGGSYFAHLAGLDDLVVLMDEAHRYRAAAGMRAIAELAPMLGLEFTATPRIAGKGGQRFGNVVYSYGLGEAIEDGLVKRPAVATRANFDASSVTDERLEEVKLEDGMRAHENTRIELALYAEANGLPVIHPFVLVVAKDVAHAGRIRAILEGPTFMGGRYLGKVAEVHSALGAEENEASTKRLLALETDTVTEVVVHVNKLKEGWDVTNLYTIVPLRASAAEILTEQTLGRGLRLPYGRRTGVEAVDALTVIAHDQFEAIIRQAQQPGSILFKTVRIGEGGDLPSEPAILVDVRPKFEAAALEAAAAASPTSGPAARAAAAVALRVMKGMTDLPTIGALALPEVRQAVVARVTAEMSATCVGQEAEDRVDIDSIVGTLAARIVGGTIDIPEIVLLPDSETSYRYETFDIADPAWLLAKRPIRDELLLQDLMNDRRRVLRLDGRGRLPNGPGRHLVQLLSEFPDVDYAACADVLHDLAGKVVATLSEQLGEDDVDNVMAVHGPDIAAWLHGQMLRHCVESPVAYSARISAGRAVLRPFPLRLVGEPCDVRNPVNPLPEIRRRTFSGFRRCLYPMQVFQSDEERQFAAMIDLHEESVVHWMKPAPGQFRIEWAAGRSYEPDFVVETTTDRLIVEVKAARDMDAPEVRAKAAAAVTWVSHANQHAAAAGGKPWSYLLVPHDRIVASNTLGGLVAAFGSDAPGMWRMAV